MQSGCCRLPCGLLHSWTKMTTTSAAIIRESASLPERDGGLARRAGLLWLGTAVQQLIRFASGFFLSPLIVRSLGIELYGAWTMIQQSTGYLTLSDLRPAASLRVAVG